MTRHFLALVGFGNVGRALIRLLVRKSDELHDRYGLDWRVTGIATARQGIAVNLNGIDAAQATRAVESGAGLSQFHSGPAVANIPAFIRACGADVFFEVSSLNPHTGEPAMSYIREALNAGMHVVTANKGPIVHGYRELRDLAAAQGLQFRFEATVLGGAPIFSLFRETLQAANLLGFRGILNSTTNLILSLMEQGTSFDDAVKHAQAIGVAETDPSADVDGWDATVKLTALAVVLMEYPIKVADVERTGIRGLTVEQAQRARSEGRPYKLVCSAERIAGGLRASVRPEQVAASDPLAGVSGTSSIVQFRTDVLKEITLIEAGAGPDQTAYGLLADFIGIVTKPTSGSAQRHL